MNKIYKVIWSKTKNSYVVASELAKSRTKSPKTNVFGVSFVAGVLACVMTCGAVFPVYAEGNTGIGVNGVSDQSMNHDGGGALGYDSIAIGDSKSAGSASISIGAGTLVTGQNSIAIGTNAMASGDGATREIVDRLLRNNKEIREGLDAARSDYTASTNAYNLQLEKFNKTNEAVARVNAANQLIAGYQNEIDNTLQPNADVANDNYNQAKAVYDDLSNRLAQQLEVVKYIDFTQYKQEGSDTIDTNAVAAEIKAQAEAGTDFNYPQEMYKAYVDSYIESEGNGRQNFAIASVLKPSVSYQNNNTVQRINLVTGCQSVLGGGTIRGIADNFFRQVGWENPDIGDVFSDISFGGTFSVKDDTGEMFNIVTDRVSAAYGSTNGYGSQQTAHIYSLSIPEGSGYYNYARSKTLTDEEYTTKVNTLETAVNNQLTYLENKFIPMRDSGVLNEAEIEKLNEGYEWCRQYELGRADLIKQILGYAHEQYLYEKYKDEEGENSVNALAHLAKQAEFKEAVTNVIGEAQAEQLFTHGSSSGIVYKGKAITESIPYGEINLSVFDWVPMVNRRIIDWYKENIVDHQNLVKYTLNQLENSMNDFLEDKRTAYDEATVAKTAADKALADKQAQITKATPSQADIDAANAAAATATALQQKADKLEADRVALEAAKSALDNLQSIEESGQGAVAIGNNAITTGKDALGIGSDSISTGEEAVALGKQNVVAAKQAIGLGSSNSVSGEESLAIGHNNGVTGVQSLAVGTGHVVTGSHSGAIGDPNIVNGDNSYVVGNNSRVEEGSTDVFILGNNAVASGNNSVVLGTLSSGSQNNVVSVGHKATDLDVNGQPYGTAMNRRIVNVANGVDANDAVNVSQLNATVNGLGNRLKLAGIGINGVGSQSMNFDGSGAIGYDSVAIGDAKSAGSASISIGAGALVTGQNSIAIGTNSMASGDGMTRQHVDEMLSNNRSIREGLDTARSAFTASENAYNLSLERFNKTNEAVARVQAANQVVAGYQAEIDNTYQPAADTANVNYQAAKSAYDGLEQTLQERLAAIKYIDFTEYTTDDVVDTNAVAAELKTQTETGTNFNYPQQFYKAYVDAYIESEGNGRSTFLIAQNMNPTTSYSDNNTVENLHIITSNSKIPSVLVQIGLASSEDDVSIFSEYPISYQTSARMDAHSGELLSSPSNYFTWNAWSRYTAWAPLTMTDYYKYCKTVTLNDEDYQSKVSTINSSFDNHINLVTSKFNRELNSGIFGPDEIANIHHNIDRVTEYENGRRQVLLDIVGYAHEGYLYEKFRDEEGEGSSNALEHLSRQGEYKHSIMQALGDTYGERLFLAGNSDTVYYQGYPLEGYTASYVDHAPYSKVTGLSDFFAHYNKISSEVFNWYKSNIVDSQNLVKYTLNQLKGSMTDFLAENSAAYTEATAAKTAADNALAQKQAQLNAAQPSAQDVADANAAQAAATALQQKADKLDADRTALENAKASLDELQSIEEAGRGAIAIGDTAVTTGQDAIGMGTNVIVTGESALALGKENIVSGDRSVALGTSNSISEAQSIAIGTGNGITGENSIAIGNDNVISGNNSIAIGNSLNITEDNVVSIGNRKMTNVATGTADTDAVNVKQLNDAIADIDLDIDVDGQIVSGNTGLINGGMVFNEVRSANGNYVQASKSAGENINLLDTALKSLDTSAIKYANEDHSLATFDATNGTKLSNLKAGVVSANSMDAINGSQLYAVKQDITGFASDIARNSENIRTMNASVTSALSSVAASGLLVDTMDVSKADASLNNLTEGGKQVLKQYAATAVQEYMAAQHGNSSAPMVPMMYAGNPNTLSVTNAGNGSLHVGEGSYVNGASSIAIGVGNQVNANNSGAFGDPSIINADESYVLGNDDTINTGATGSFIVGNDGVSDAKGGLLFGSNTKARAEAVDGIALGNRAEVSAPNAIALGSNSVADLENTLSIGNTNIKRKIVNVANGDVSQNSNEAITGAQLFLTNEKVQQNTEAIEEKANKDASNIDVAKWSEKLATGVIESGNTGLVNGGTVYEAVNNVANFALAASVVKTDGENIYVGPELGGTVVNVQNKDGESRVITGVATNPKDNSSAANVGYVNAVGESLMQFTNSAFQKVDNKINKAGASAAAMANLPTPTFDGEEKWALSAGVGHYQGETASAVGVFYKPQDNVIARVSGTFGNGDEMVGAGVSVSLNKVDTPVVSKAQLLREVNGLKAERAADKNLLAAQNAKIQDQDNKIAQLQEQLVRVTARLDEMAK